MKCPACESEKVTTTWIQHSFQYGVTGEAGTINLGCFIPLRSCGRCGEKWLDHVGEDIITKVVDIQLSKVDVNTYAWKEKP